ncbi:MAG TPA: tetratricopeptide repeat protein, partial [Nitrospiraceae bacterium]|nr:tetratricopeptide repeat protein [Nitrospiraceae bacterium]
MSDFEERIEAALVAGEWDTAFDAASAWAVALERSADRNSRPFFALNVVHLIRGEFAAAWKMHAKGLEDPGDIEQVKIWVEGIRDRHPDRANAHLLVGLFLSQAGQSEQSIEVYKTAARLDPQSAYPHYFLAQIHERAARPELAIKEYREAVRLNPGFAPARTNLGVAYQDQGRLEMAIPQYREVIKLNPNDAVAHANLACALAEQGKLEPAVQAYKEAIR